MVTFTLTPVFPLLTLALAGAAAVTIAWSFYLLALLTFRRRLDLLGKVNGWQAVTCALVSAALFSAGTWQFGGLFAVLAGACGLLWRKTGKRGGKIT